MGACGDASLTRFSPLIHFLCCLLGESSRKKVQGDVKLWLDVFLHADTTQGLVPASRWERIDLMPQEVAN